MKAHRNDNPTGRRLATRHALVLAMAAVMCGGALVGCAEERMVSNTYGPFGEREQSEEEKNRWQGDMTGASWAIALGRITGDNHRQIAESQRAKLAAGTGMTDVWVQDEGGMSMVYYGRYESPQDPQAQQDLERWQALASSGRVKLPVVMLAPVTPGVTRTGDTAQYDLRHAARRGQYTLQIGYYDETLESDPRYKGTSFRKVSEEAVAALRKDGHDAYYYHGPTRSMVTIGVFRENDVEVKLDRSGAPIYSQQVESLRKQFPYNVGNGLTLRETLPGGEKRDLPSFLVRIPGAKPQPLDDDGTRRAKRRPDDWFLTN